ncbi:putative Splicing factor U2af 38 kDa subunit [Paratrimastix pyriformis]|uniref:Splicing factor U2af 38 kDa subunit n=1 Tax=Paratrimastix pyriformis TaxID=342808 RepID=A0ABQ8UDX5_9EUKA|nr:putative Splicing factor U2af 38 kDa subunit [Paratrimastix pyriformis]
MSTSTAETGPPAYVFTSQELYTTMDPAQEARSQAPPPRPFRGERERVRDRAEHAQTAAERLATIYGTEQDRVNCPFYFKIGACRYGDTCSRQHNRPTASQTVLLKHLYVNPLGFEGGQSLPPEVLQKQFDDFYEDVFSELQKYGEIEELHVCDNICEHMFGNVYVMYSDEESASKCLAGVQGRFYGGRPIQAELSPVTEFKDARCRQFEQSDCNRAGMCNFIHERQISQDLRAKLMKRNRHFRIRGVHDFDGDDRRQHGGRVRLTLPPARHPAPHSPLFLRRIRRGVHLALCDVPSLCAIQRTGTSPAATDARLPVGANGGLPGVVTTTHGDLVTTHGGLPGVVMTTRAPLGVVMTTHGGLLHPGVMTTLPLRSTGVDPTRARIPLSSATTIGTRAIPALGAPPRPTITTTITTTTIAAAAAGIPHGMRPGAVPDTGAPGYPPPYPQAQYPPPQAYAPPPTDPRDPYAAQRQQAPPQPAPQPQQPSFPAPGGPRVDGPGDYPPYPTPYPQAGGDAGYPAPHSPGDRDAFKRPRPSQPYEY